MQDTDDNLLDRISRVTGRLTAWLTVFMVVLTCIIVVMRYVFDAGLIWMQERVLWMHAVVFMVGAAYTLKNEEHVRVDVFYGSMSEQRRAWIDAIGVVVFLLPVCAYIAWTSLSYVGASWRDTESSPEAGGLPFPMLPLLKTVLLVMPILLGLQGVSLFVKSVNRIRGR